MNAMAVPEFLWLDRINTGIVLLDKHFRVAWINDTLCSFFRIKREEVLGKAGKELIQTKIKYLFEDPEYFAERVINTYENNTYPEDFICKTRPAPEGFSRILKHCSVPVLDGIYGGGRVEEYHDVTAEKVDAHTGLFNYGYLKNVIEMEYARAARYGQRLALIMMDVDRFKEINDNFGHLFGDKVLEELALLLKSSMRVTDIPCRYGGEEFTLIMPAADYRGAYAVAERLRSKVVEHIFKDNGHSCHITLTAGVASTEDKGVREAIDLIKYADVAMLKGKERGKNRVLTWRELQSS